MIEVLFKGQLNSSGPIISLLNEFAEKVRVLEFADACRCIDLCAQFIDEERNQAQASSDEPRLNQLYVVSAFLSMLHDYSRFWSRIIEHAYSASWDTLQDVRDGIRIVKRFHKEYSLRILDLIEQQIVSFEQLYPYRVFASMDVIVGNVECSICGKSMDSFDCPHIRGELYGGKMAHGIVGEIKAVNSVSLVEHPADKRCVVQIADTQNSFPGVAYLSRLLSERRISPWQLAGINRTTRKKRIDESQHIGVDDDCPCGSGEKFKECCLTAAYVEVPHIELLVSKPMVPVFSLTA